MLSLLFSCVKGDLVKDQLDETLVVNAFLDINKPIENIQLSRLNALSGDVNQKDIDAHVRILHEDEEYVLDEISEGLYGLNDPSILVEPDGHYELIIDADGKTLTASTRTPLDHMGYTVTKSEIVANEVGDQLDITFTEVPSFDVFYLVKIVPLDETLQPVVVVNPTARDEKSFFVYNGDNNIVSILGTYFTYLGKHEIEVHRINEAFLPLFSSSFSDDGFASSGNIMNGLGNFVGTERVSVEINVE